MVRLRCYRIERMLGRVRKNGKNLELTAEVARPWAPTDGRLSMQLYIELIGAILSGRIDRGNSEN